MRLDSVRVSVLMTSMATAHNNAEKTVRIGPSPISPNPGRRMTSAPRNPMAMAPQRTIPTCSLKTKKASTLAKIGAVKVSAVTSAKGAMVTA